MATITSTTSGLASVGGTWVGGIAPVEGDKVIIAAGHTVTLDGALTWGDDTAGTVTSGVMTGGAIQVSGTLEASRSVNSSLTAKGDINILSGGVVDFGTEADPVDSVLAELYLNKSATLSSVEFGMYCNTAGAFYFYGAAKTVNAVLTAAISAGATSIDVDDATGWQIGDRIVIACDTDNQHNYLDQRTIGASYTPGSTTVPLSSATTYAHDVDCPVGNFNHTVQVKSYNASYPGYVGWFDTQTTAEYSRKARYTLFENLGDGNHANTWKWSGFSAYASTSFAKPDYCTSALNDVSIWAFDNNLSVGISMFYVKRRVTYSDIAYYGSASQRALYEAASAVADIHRLVTYKTAYAISSGYSQGGANCRHYDCKFFGCSSTFLSLPTSMAPEFYDCILGPSASTGGGIPSQALLSAKFVRCDLGYTYPSAYSQLFYGSWEGSLLQARLIDCKFQAGKPICQTITAGYRIQDWASASYIVVANKDVDPLSQEVYLPGGLLSRDNTFSKDTSGTSLKIAPWANAVEPAASTFQVFAPDSKPIPVSGYIYLDPAYNGDDPTVTIEGLGESYTWTGDKTITGEWQQFLVAITQTTGSDGMVDVTVSCNGSAGAMWVDGVVAPTPVAVNTGEFGYWYNGQPASIIAANYVAAIDVWNTQTSALTLTGSIGKLLTDGKMYIDVGGVLIPL